MDILEIIAAWITGGVVGLLITLVTFLAPERLRRRRMRKAIESATPEELARRLAYLRRERTWHVEVGNWDRAGEEGKEIALIEEVIRSRTS